MILPVLAKNIVLLDASHSFYHGASILKNDGKLLSAMWINEGNSTVWVIQGSGEIARRTLSGLNIRKLITLLTLVLLRLYLDKMVNLF